MLTVADFRRIALNLQGATEGSHMGHPDFRANGRIFASIYPDNRRAMVKLTPDLQQQYVHAHPGMFEPATGAWGRQGSTTVHLALEEEAAGILGIPYDEITQLALIPFGYVNGDPFKPAHREPLDLVLHWDRW